MGRASPSLTHPPGPQEQRSESLGERIFRESFQCAWSLLPVGRANPSLTSLKLPLKERYARKCANVFSITILEIVIKCNSMCNNVLDNVIFDYI